MTQFYFIILMMPAVKAEVENRLSGMETEKQRPALIISNKSIWIIFTQSKHLFVMNFDFGFY